MQLVKIHSPCLAAVSWFLFGLLICLPLLAETERALKTPASDAGLPNLIVIMADDLGYGDVSCYGGWIETPHLDRLASEGLRFTDFHSNGAVCSPTRAALLTGRYQQRVGIPSVIVARRDAKEHQNGMRSAETTFAEGLRQQGYATAIFGKWHLGYYPRFNPCRHGFDEFRGYLSGNIDFFSHVDQAGQQDWWRNEERIDEEGYVTHLIKQHAVRFIEQNRDRPFCLYLPHEAPHYPYQGPNDRADRTVNGNFDNHGSRSDKKQAYREMVQEMDKTIGAIVESLRKLDLHENTLIFFCSDNGATRLGSNGRLRGTKGSVWEGGHRVPAIAWWPGRIRSGETKSVALSMDLMPTLLGLANAQNTDTTAMDGTDLSALLLSRDDLPHRTVFWDTTKAQAARAGQWKLVKLGPNATPQLFDLENDLAEQQDVRRENPALYRDLTDKLRMWAAEVQLDSHLD